MQKVDAKYDDFFMRYLFRIYVLMHEKSLITINN